MSKENSSKIVVSASEANNKVCPTRPMKGGDPEVMLVRNGVVISSTDVLGSAREPACAGLSAEVFSDGFQAEINFPATGCRESLIGYITQGLMGFRNRGCKVKICPVVYVDPEWLKTSPMSVRVSGCKPDFDAYTDGNQNPPVPDFDTLPIRFAGGHVAVDCKSGSYGGAMIKGLKDVVRFIKLMDRIVGIPSIIAANGKGERLRRKYYGRPGCFRYHEGKYIEYRSMSNWWMASPVYTWIVYGLVDLATTIYYSGMADLYLNGVSDDEVVETMMNCDKERAEGLLARMLPSLVAISGLSGGPLDANDKLLGYIPMVHASLAALRDLDPSKDVFEEWKVDAYEASTHPMKWLAGEGIADVPNELGGPGALGQFVFGSYINGMKSYSVGSGPGTRSIIVSAVKNYDQVQRVIRG